MTQEQKDLIISVLRMGIACGLYSYWEAYLNYNQFIPQIFPYKDAPQKEKELNEAFAAFLRDTASNPDDYIKSIKPEDIPAHMVTMHDSYRKTMEKWAKKFNKQNKNQTNKERRSP